MYIAAKMALAWTQVNNCTDEFIYVWISVLSNYCLNANSEQHVWIFLQKSKVIHVLPTHWLSFGNWMKQCEHHQQFLKFWHILILTKCYQKQIIFYISIDATIICTKIWWNSSPIYFSFDTVFVKFLLEWITYFHSVVHYKPSQRTRPLPTLSSP